MSDKKKKIPPIYETMPHLNGDKKEDDGTNVKIPSNDDVEDLHDFSKEHKL